MGSQAEGLLAGKVIVVTGSGGGIGAEVAKTAAREGAMVVVNDIGASPGGDGLDPSAANGVVAEIEAAGGKAVASIRDVSKADDARGIIDDALNAFGRIDGVVNNAGVVRDSIFHKMEDRDWNIAIAVNLTGAFNVARAAAPHFKAQASGAFVHMSSSSGLIGNFGQANYGAAKMGIAGLSKCIALDMARFTVRSNCIAPAAFTRLVGTIPAEKGDNAERLAMVRRMTPDKIAGFTVALLTDQAQDVTGQIFGVRQNEIVLYSQPRPIRTVHNADGWSASDCVDRALPALRPSMYKLDRSGDVFAWDPI